MSFCGKGLPPLVEAYGRAAQKTRNTATPRAETGGRRSAPHGIDPQGRCVVAVSGPAWLRAGRAFGIVYRHGNRHRGGNNQPQPQWAGDEAHQTATVLGPNGVTAGNDQDTRLHRRGSYPRRPNANVPMAVCRRHTVRSLMESVECEMAVAIRLARGQLLAVRRQRDGSAGHRSVFGRDDLTEHDTPRGQLYVRGHGFRRRGQGQLWHAEPDYRQTHNHRSEEFCIHSHHPSFERTEIRLRVHPPVSGICAGRSGSEFLSASCPADCSHISYRPQGLHQYRPHFRNKRPGHGLDGFLLLCMATGIAMAAATTPAMSRG